MFLLLSFRSLVGVLHDIIIIISLIVSFFAIWLTRGICIGYLGRNISQSILFLLLCLHIIASLFIALILPNNFLTKYDFFKNLYAGDELWIPVSMATLMFLLFNVIGLFFTFCCYILGIGMKKE